ncbi:hypothetical protein PsAD2_01824 [Pseudovibrio axinellae]|uniref:Restriction endonuclease type IV Mrr domain-containing protein n=1 Tax=Pseudovibrio axinellae TaxID=989403 RepID=A0A165Z676_9HYPH|nr:restriction endonuclease [Pseudovibrio axinellae]KZL19546.1 hypothetical protein PsAD2_01824 [Pseudovibrio axinellae]SEQ31368.1 Restriction endonuclease [Pseudovibrio axinellae]
MKIPDWKKYQEDTAEFFRSLGLEAKTDYAIEGVRTKHDIDVFVVSKLVGLNAIWLIECKYWARPVSKLHVLALREIVSDVGADKGIILSENGFQKGAVEAAKFTNIEVNSLAKLRGQLETVVYSIRLRNLAARVTACEKKYWSLPKSKRIEFGLRPPGGIGFGYNGGSVIDACRNFLFEAATNDFPFSTGLYFDMPDMLGVRVPEVLKSNQDVNNWIEPMVEILEKKIETVPIASHD